MVPCEHRRSLQTFDQMSSTVVFLVRGAKSWLLYAFLPFNTEQHIFGARNLNHCNNYIRSEQDSFKWFVLIIKNPLWETVAALVAQPGTCQVQVHSCFRARCNSLHTLPSRSMERSCSQRGMPRTVPLWLPITAVLSSGGSSRTAGYILMRQRATAMQLTSAF